ncbi:MAG: aspartate kinase [Bacteroidales bacterium]|nr:aspartate kinase [Bacteroidales bacterium]
MRVFKFGGASVKDAQSIINLASIEKNITEPLVIVISAMGKTTNAMERLVDAYFNKTVDLFSIFEEIKKYHLDISNELFKKSKEKPEEFLAVIDSLEEKIKQEPSLDFNFEYDQVVSYGELLSTTLISAYLNNCGIYNKWVDIRKGLRTDNHFCEAKVDFELSSIHIPNLFDFTTERIFITQGFIGSTSKNLTTTLGREGSDYTAALLAYFLNAQSVTVWKDVPGILNADPKWFDDTVRINQLNYTDAIELAFYGASVIHPKTIQPLQTKGIPLYVRSFKNPGEQGTTIGNVIYDSLIPSFIFKVDQVLLEICPNNLSFITEENLQYIFAILFKYELKVNLMQNTAVNFKICVDNHSDKIAYVLKELDSKYHIDKTEQLELITIRYYNQETIDRVLINKEVIVEHRSKRTIQMVVTSLN